MENLRCKHEAYFTDEYNPQWSGSTKPEKDVIVPVKGGLTDAHLCPITRRNWKSVISWAAFHPDEVSRLLDRKGQSALHHACLFKAPAHVVEALLYASPESASIANDDGELPIHWAVRVAAPGEILKLLLEASPKSGLVADVAGSTALSLLWDRHFESLVDIGVFPDVEPSVAVETAEANVLVKGAQGTSWDRIMVLVRSSYCGATSNLQRDFSKFRPLHGCVGSNCPLSLVIFVMRVCGSQLQERDDSGRLPLSAAAASQEVNEAYSKALIEKLLEFHRNAVCVEDWGRKLPLTLAIESGKTWEGGVQALFEAEPRALSTRDVQSGMYPFMLASIENGKSCDLNTIFCLLRADPECVRSFGCG